MELKFDLIGEYSDLVEDCVHYIAFAGLVQFGPAFGKGLPLGAELLAGSRSVQKLDYNRIR